MILKKGRTCEEIEKWQKIPNAYFVDFSVMSEKTIRPSTGLKTSASLRRRSRSEWFARTSPLR